MAVFVFGSNLAGIHGAGAARYAERNLGAKRGVGFGPTGKCYALPTKDSKIKPLGLAEIASYVEQFITYAGGNPDLTFEVTQIGCGLAGYTVDEIAPLFKQAPLNCQFDTAWRPVLGDTFTYWGHVA